MGEYHWVAETERLKLRRFSPSDAVFFHELNSDPEVMKYTGDKPFDSVKHAQGFLENYADYQLNEMGRWLLVLKKTNESIGWCGLKMHRDTGEVDIGFRLMKKHHNYGYATEASIACVELAKNKYRLPYIIGRVVPGNSSSQRVLEKIGMVFTGYVNDGVHDVKRYKLKLTS